MTLLQGRLAVVSGASRGIGLAIASALSAAGARVVRVARTLEPGIHGPFLDYPADLTDPAAVSTMAARVLAEAGTPAILVNNAGVFDRMPFESAPVEELARQLQVNLVGAFALTRAFVPAMRQAGDGLVVTLGSTADQTAWSGNTVYSATKYGLRGLIETLAVEYRGTGLRFTLVAPGQTDTPIWDTVSGAGPTRPHTDMLTAEDVAEAVLFVATRPPRVTIDVLRLTPS